MTDIQKAELELMLPKSRAIHKQIDIANRRIIRCNRHQLDNEYAEGVRDALSWIIGQAMMPFNDQEEPT